MAIYTKEAFGKFVKTEDGYTICPVGDYTKIYEFPDNCYFESHSIFGFGVTFGENTRFGCDSIFGERCEFGKGCHFDEACTFGKKCKFNDFCEFKRDCDFGLECTFGNFCHVSYGVFSSCTFGNDSFFDVCVFGPFSIFGDRCEFSTPTIFGGNTNFGKQCSIDKKEFVEMLQFSGFGDREIYFFKLADGTIYVRYDARVGDLNKFRDTYVFYGLSDLERQEFLMMADLAEKRWNA